MENIKNGAFKRKKINFTQVSNIALRDKKLSLKAKGLYSLIQSFITIENFTLYKNTLRKYCSEGNKAFESTWKELKDCSYLVQEKHQNSDGTFYYIYDLLDAPNQTPKKEGMDKGGSGKGGVYNNTDLNNTKLNNTNKNDNGDSLDSERTAFLFPNSDIVNAIKAYMTNLYKQRKHRKHPYLKPEQYKRVYDSLDAFCKDTGIDYDGLITLMCAFLNSDITSDYNINHFATDGILLNRFYEELY